MEDIRSYRAEEDEPRRNEDDRVEYSAAPPDDEVPFHIPRD
ncbi:MAG TPA: hypothetical protein VEK79_20270 [Thermoanaerobaculia bacterium]|nr:hypothetical protein [Thermoanaerobaculia bacterium]